MASFTKFIHHCTLFTVSDCSESGYNCKCMLIPDLGFCLETSDLWEEQGNDIGMQ
jgi:hypothetical protein